MDIMCWNARGAASTKFRYNMMELINKHRMDILFVCEPRISGSKALDVIKSLGYSCFEVVDSVGFSGGLWLLWNDDKVSVEVIGTTDQSISAVIAWPGQPPWMFTAIYAKPCRSNREQLWEYLNFVAQSHQMPWLLAGDFNEMLNCDDKLGGAPPSQLKGFRKWFDDNELLELGYSGPKFTWSNNRVFEKLDRAICNMQWRGLFVDAHVQILPRTKSDHCPIKISLKSSFCSTRSLRPFRFEAMWMQHAQFKDFIMSQWDLGSGSALEKSCALVEPLKHWNLNVFGALRQKKAKLLRRLAGIQKALCFGPNNNLLQLEATLSDDYNSVLEQEALFWRQKSRVQWLQNGDRNTKFFHMTTLIRRRRNKLERLKNESGTWIEGIVGIKEIAVNYFLGLFSQTQGNANDLNLPNLFPTIASQDLDLLTKDVDMLEVKESLFSIGGLKAPGVDGFPACFFQSNWQLCGNDIFDMVCTSFRDCIIPEGLNSTLITLVPKIENPHSMAQFRPISLCSTLYKVISKILVARLRPILPSLISPNQVSFVPGRQINDNILIAQELMHKFRIAKGKKGFIAWKIDLSKAYDRLRWNFIELVLVELRLPPPTVQLIMQCVSSVKYQVCVNGELTNSFSPSNGIRQGDPLSPYLFVLCIEKLSHIIFDAVRSKQWKSVKSSQSGPSVSHLFFADDLILFGEATPKQARIMKHCLEVFCQASGQTVNFDKSAVLCSPNTCRAVAMEVSLICGSPLKTNLGKYLGMPLIHSKVTKATYGDLLDKVHARLASWKSKMLSLAGRATLIHSVTSTLPVYAMQTVKLPISICEKLDQINRNFFWGGNERKQKIHLCQWDIVCRPKNLGGLGFKKTQHLNQALLAKTGWRLFQRDDGLWAKVFESKYLKGRSILEADMIPRQGCSSTWRGVVFGSKLLNKGLKWRVGNGDQVLFWKDKWIDSLPPLIQEVPVTGADLGSTVSEFHRDGWWDVAKLRCVLPDELIQRIICCPADFGGHMRDSQIWFPSSNGIFSTKSAYQLLFNGSEWSDPWWKTLWKMKIPPKLKIFYWLVYQGKILSNEQRVRRHLTYDASCMYCGGVNESVLHILRDCSRARIVWAQLLKPHQATCFFHTDLRPWLLSNMCSKDAMAQGPWKLTFVFACWFIWKWRNNHVFNSVIELPFCPRMVIFSAVHDWIKASTITTKAIEKTQVFLAWSPPVHGTFKLNVDGSQRAASGCIGAGGILRNSLGEWNGGFAINLGIGQVLEAELWGLFFGLKLAADNRISKLIIEMDSAIAVQLIQQHNLLLFHPLAALVSSCVGILNKFVSYEIYHIYREKNTVADRLASWSHNLDLGLYLLDEAPDWLGPVLVDDLLGLSKPRMICVF